MKQFKITRKVAVFLLAAIMVITMTATVFAIAIMDEDGNIIENEVLEGGIVPMMGELDWDYDNYDYLDSEHGFFVFTPSYRSETGEVVEFWQNDHAETEFVRIRIHLENDEYTHADFLVDNNTFVMGEEPALGDTITGFFDTNMPMIMIYPPQYNTVVLVNRAENLPRVIVARFNEEWVSSDEQFHLRLNEDTPISFQGGDVFEGDISELVGRKLVVEFTVSHRNIPETIPNPQKVTVLYERAVHPTLNLDEGWGEGWDENFDFAYDAIGHSYNVYDTAVVNDVWQSVEWHGFATVGEIDWSAYDIIITINGLSLGVPNAQAKAVDDSELPNFVPLRAITEMLGFTPVWNAETKSIKVNSPHGEISLRVGDPYYAIQSPSGVLSTFTLDAPVIIDGSTYVPIRFFRDVFGFNNAWWEGGNVSLDNAERME
ncbi:MAG: copper amine oxidase N-terminal domain-containing protein [Defluviitaleaceae bacterium]|nr:copper amine oxidase N-terminal domain-containing protein [Defluviitaleaceae bacterium]